MILDTCFIIDLMNSKKEAVEKIKELDKLGKTQATTAISIFELWCGLSQCNKPKKEKKKIMEVLSSQIVYELDKQSAETGGEIYGQLVKKGNRIDAEDCMIAGIAIVQNKTIVTKDEHYDRIDKLNIEVY